MKVIVRTVSQTSHKFYRPLELEVLRSLVPLKREMPDSPMHPRMKLSNSLFVLTCIAISGPCFSQCAPGIPSAGNPGCIPPTAPGSPYALPDGTVQPPVPVEQKVRWADSFGAIAYDHVEVKAGNSEDKPSKKAAEDTAMDYCRRNGGKDCQIAVSYHNQCASVAQAPSGGGNVYFATAAEPEDADRYARQDCGPGCITVLSKCSLPKPSN